VEDIDKDGRQEVIFILPGCAYGESQEGKICVVRSDGSNMPNWPIVPEPGKYNRISSFAVGDINNDGYAEIVATRGRQKVVDRYTMSENILYAYKYDATPLPGFPITLAIDQYESGSVSLSDVNKDGYLDIVANFGTSALISRGFNRTKSLAAYDYKGRLIKRQMLEKQIFGGYLAIGDTNKDALPEIVLGSISNNAQYLGGLWLYDSNFKLVPGWPAGKDLCFQTSPTTIGNLDNNNKGNKQIVGYSLTNGNVQGGVHVFDKLGKQLFHKAIVPNPVAVEPILVDLDKDGDLEIVTTDAYGDVYGYHHDGTEVWEFPLVPEFLNINYPALDCQLVAGDIDADGYPEILLMTNDSLSRVALNAFKRDGTVVPGFPRVYSKNYIGLSIGGIALADLDGNGLVEIVCLLSDTYDGTSRRTYLGSLELPQPYQKNNMDWPMFRYDPQKTGCYRPAGSGVPIVPVKPENLVAKTISDSQINLSWTDKSNNEQGFKIERSTNNTTFSQIAVAGIDSNNYPDSGLIPGTRYYYRIKSYNAIGDAGYTIVVNATTLQIPPAAPTNLTATAVAGSNKNLTLSWTDNANNEQGFKVYHSADGTAFTQIGTVGAKAGTAGTATYAHNNLVPGSTHYYKILAYNLAGNSSYSNTAQISMPALNLPAAPSNLTATAATGSNKNLTLSWTDNANNEQGFKVYHSTDGTTFTQLTSVGAKTGTGATVTCPHNNLVPGSTHYYKVVAYNVDGNSSASNTAQITMPPLKPPAAPSNLSATAVTGSNRNLTLSWTDNANDEQGFKIQHSTDGTNFTQLSSVAAKAGTGQTVTLAHNNLVPGSTHYYKVVAFNVDGNSSASNTAQITMPPLNPPAAPSNLTATAVTGSKTSLALSWTDNASNEQGFKIQHSTNGTTFAQIATVVAKAGTGATVTYTHNSLVSGSTHYYKIVAYNVDGDSAASNIASATVNR
jgi:hypothetical protein